MSKFNFGAMFRKSLNKRGQGLVEYGLIVGLTAVVAMSALNTTGNRVNTLIKKVSTSLSTVS